ncbi:DUF302 domain-containing protein [Verrucomicrobium sp. 3C]|uniref:DUF302 domain-containing protein n=1 Tax=Verrucomicrobium sp. 3C TaxID=1134055 RepID=UPI0003A4218B|nr:DUF302 domain-containing protein [Verrucomicrobium sp. 3C]
MIRQNPLPTGLFHWRSPYGVPETVRRLKDALAVQRLIIFAHFDHSRAAQEVGFQMPPTEVLVFGNPKGGTPLMLAAPTLAIDLPSKILVREGDGGTVEVFFNTMAYLKERHCLIDMDREVAAFDQKVIEIIRSSLG